MEKELAIYKEQIEKLNDLNLSARIDTLDISTNKSKRMFSYFRSSYGNNMTEIITPLDTLGFIDISSWENIPEYDIDASLDITRIWEYLLLFFKKFDISLEKIIINRDALYT